MKLRTVSLGRISVVTGLLVGLLASLAALTAVAEPPSILLGGAFMLADFHLIRLLVSRLIAPGMSQGWTVLLLTAKFLFGIVLIAGVMYQLPVEPLSFAAGASVLLVAIVLDASVFGSPVEPGEGPTGDAA